MIVRAGTAVTFPVLFSDGVPDGPLSFQLFDSLGVLLSAGTVSVPADAVSVNLTVPAEHNLLPMGSVLGYRDLAWTYSVGGEVRNDERRYSLEARLPFGVSTDGVRAKLGVDRTDLPDSDISLAKAFMSFRDTIGANQLALVAPDTPTITDAIEAQAALDLIPTMSVRVAAQEDSGTNAYKRQKIDWSEISTHLAGLLSAGYLLVDPTYDETALFGDIFILATPATDPLTGAPS